MFDCLRKRSGVSFFTRKPGVWIQASRGTDRSFEEAAVDLKTLHAKIDELMLANDLLSGVLGEAGLPREKA